MKKFFWIFVILFSLAMIMFSLGFNSLEKAYAMEENTEEVIEQPIEQPTEELPSVEETPSDELPIVDEYTKKVTEWIIAGLCGLLGTSAVAVAFRKQLKELIANILSALGVLKTNKDETEKQVKAIQDKAEKTLARLEKVKEEMFEENKEQSDEVKKQIGILTKAIMFIACGMTELVANGTSETISDMLKGKENEGKEV